MKKRYLLEIEVDEKEIIKKYPNYKFNWSTPKEFIKHLLKDIEEKCLKEYGYSKKIIKEIK